MGYKDARLGGSSAILLPICEEVRLTGRQNEDPNSPNWGKNIGGCGGDNPVFIGWPIAWQSKDLGPWSYRVGYFHMSSWFDGGFNFTRLGDKSEAKLDMFAISTTFNWTRWRHKKRGE